MELFGYPLIKHLEVFSIIFLIAFTLISIIRIAGKRYSFKDFLIGACLALLNTLYFVLLATFYQFTKVIDSIFIIVPLIFIFSIVGIPIYMGIRSYIETLDIKKE